MPNDHPLLLLGTFVDAPTPTQLRVRERHLCIVSSQGRILKLQSCTGDDPDAISEVLPEEWRHLPIQKLSSTQFIVPGMVDCHVQSVTPSANLQLFVLIRGTALLSTTKSARRQITLLYGIFTHMNPPLLISR
jgi:hypothetical protein